MEPSSYAAEKKGKGGIRRVINAFGYSIDGIAAERLLLHNRLV